MPGPRVLDPRVCRLPIPPSCRGLKVKGNSRGLFGYKFPPGGSRVSRGEVPRRLSSAHRGADKGREGDFLRTVIIILKATHSGCQVKLQYGFKDSTSM